MVGSATSWCTCCCLKGTAATWKSVAMRAGTYRPTPLSPPKCACSGQHPARQGTGMAFSPAAGGAAPTPRKTAAMNRAAAPEAQNTARGARDRALMRQGARTGVRDRASGVVDTTREQQDGRLSNRAPRPYPTPHLNRPTLKPLEEPLATPRKCSATKPGDETPWTALGSPSEGHGLSVGERLHAPCRRASARRRTCS